MFQFPIVGRATWPRCANNFRIQPMVREDLKFIGATAVPSRETNLRRGPCCFGDYVQGVLECEGQNYINIPITMYGLERF